MAPQNRRPRRAASGVHCSAAPQPQSEEARLLSAPRPQTQSLAGWQPSPEPGSPGRSQIRPPGDLRPRWLALSLLTGLGSDGSRRPCPRRLAGEPWKRFSCTPRRHASPLPPPHGPAEVGSFCMTGSPSWVKNPPVRALRNEQLRVPGSSVVIYPRLFLASPGPKAGGVQTPARKPPAIDPHIRLPERSQPFIKESGR